MMSRAAAKRAHQNAAPYMTVTCCQQELLPIL